MIAQPINTTAHDCAVSVQLIPVNTITPSPYNRSCADMESIKELALSIKENGLINPITIRPLDNDIFEIVAGERRWRAFQFLEWSHIPAIVKQLDDVQARIESFIENFHRLNPSFFEEGEAVAYLLKITKNNAVEVANRFGKSPSWVRRRAKLQNLAPEWREELENPRTIYHHIKEAASKIEEIAILPQSAQRELLHAGTLRQSSTLREIQKTLSRFFMSLDAKPWTRDWEKKKYSSVKRCDACKNRSDRDNVLFVDPDAIGTGKAMCQNIECWLNKSLEWAKHLTTTQADIVPVYTSHVEPNSEQMREFFGCKPASPWEWESREEGQNEMDGFKPAKGVIVHGPEVGKVFDIWLEADTEDEDEEESEDTASAYAIYEQKRKEQEQRRTLQKAISADICDYLHHVGDYGKMHSVALAHNKLKAAVWFGFGGYCMEKDHKNFDSDEWNPLDVAWNDAIDDIAALVANIAVMDITGEAYFGHMGEEEKIQADALRRMFDIPIDVITMKAIEENATIPTEAESEECITGEENAADEEAAADAATDDRNNIIYTLAEQMTDENDILVLPAPTASGNPSPYALVSVISGTVDNA